MAKIPFNFGHRPRKTKRLSRKLYSVYTAVFGVSNMIKRRQMQDLFDAMNLSAGDKMLDFGASSGYISFEAAKLAEHVTAIDIVDVELRVPRRIQGKFEFVKYSGDLADVPFAAERFSIVLASGVMNVFPDNKPLFDLFHRLLRPRGRLVILAGLGRPVLKRAYECDHPAVRFARRVLGAPATYEEYERALNAEFKSRINELRSEGQIIEELENSGFTIEKRILTPADRETKLLEWYQYFAKVLTGRAVAQNNPLLFPFMNTMCWLLRRTDPARTIPFGLILIARK